jgi:uncharacterized protein (DUF433 family)
MRNLERVKSWFITLPGCQPDAENYAAPMPLDWSKCTVLESIPGKVSGAWVFRGTRVPVSAILKNLKHQTPDQLVEDYPSVPRAQIEEVLDFLARSADRVFLSEPVPAIVIHAHPPR